MPTGVPDANERQRKRRRVLLGCFAAVIAIVGAMTAVVLVREDSGSSTPGAVSRSGPTSRVPSAPAVPRPGRAVTRTTPTPILMYHVIARPPEDALYPDLYVAPRRFAAHMAYLARYGYRVVTLQQVWDHWHGGLRLPRKPVVVTFDDGSRGWYTHAHPILRKHGWVGTMNLAVNHLNRWDLPVRWARRLVGAGWEVDSHTLSHPDLTVLGDRDLRLETAGSRTRLRKLFGVPVNFFCYPTGRYDERVVAAVRKAGYLGAMTVVEGLAVPTRPFALARVRVSGSDDVAAFAAKLKRLSSPPALLRRAPGSRRQAARFAGATDPRV